MHQMRAHYGTNLIRPIRAELARRLHRRVAVAGIQRRGRLQKISCGQTGTRTAGKESPIRIIHHAVTIVWRHARAVGFQPCCVEPHWCREHRDGVVAKLDAGQTLITRMRKETLNIFVRFRDRLPEHARIGITLESLLLRTVRTAVRIVAYMLR